MASIKNGVIKTIVALGIAEKWRYDCEYDVFMPIRWAAAINTGGLWFYEYGGPAFILTRGHSLSVGTWDTIMEILVHVAVPQTGPPGVFISPWTDARGSKGEVLVKWIRFPHRPLLKDIVEEARLQQSKPRLNGVWKWNEGKVRNPMRIRVPHS